MTVINSNGAALRAQNASRQASDALSTAMARLSSGKRINSASDDAAGLAIASSMTARINGMGQAISNATNGISLLQTADGALDEVTSMVQRIRELAIQSASGTYSDSDRQNMQAEVSELSHQIDQTLKGATFNGVTLFQTDPDASGDGVTTTIQTGPSIQDRLDITIPAISTTFSRAAYANDLTVPVGYSYDRTRDPPLLDNCSSDPRCGQPHLITFLDYTSQAQVSGRNVTLDDVGKTVTQGHGDSWFSGTPSDQYDQYSEDGVNTMHPDYCYGYEQFCSGPTGTVEFSLNDEIDVSNTYRTANTINRLDDLLTTINAARAGIGASESALDSVVNTLTTGTVNLTDARSRIADADFSAETTILAKAQILSQASTAMLAQANMSAQDVLKLLKG